MENNTANERKLVYAITYTCQDQTAYLAGLFEVYATYQRAMAALKRTVNNMRDNGYSVLIDHPKSHHVILFNMAEEKEFHLFIEEKILY